MYTQDQKNPQAPKAAMSGGTLRLAAEPSVEHGVYSRVDPSASTPSLTFMTDEPSSPS
jgi:hypothetical protein